MIPSPRAPEAPHALGAAAVLTALGTDPGRGLDAAEAARRLEADGPNALAEHAGPSPWRVLAGQLKNILVVILLVAIVLSLALGHLVEAIAIGVIAAFSVGLGFVQELRAERALDALRELAAPVARVIRDGARREVPSRELVAGDLVVLAAGDVVPADARIVEAADLHVDEAALTGESVPVAKSVAPVARADAALGDRTSLVFAATAVTHGRGRAVVFATGPRTEMGKIGALLASVETAKTPLERNMDRVGAALAKAAAVVVVLVVALGLARGLPVVDMILFGIALAVAVVPEALPAVVTISLAIGAQKMARRHALIRRLPTVETLGSTSVICSDKTGTLTTGEMTVRELHAGGEVLAVGGSGYAPSGGFRRGGAPVAPAGTFLELLRGAALCTDARLVRTADGRHRIEGDPTEGALIVAAAKAGLDKDALEAAAPRTAEIAFSSERKRMTTVHAAPDGTVAYTKGAPELVLERCATELGPNGPRPLDAAARARVLAAAHEMASRALRVLAVARRRGPAAEGEAERELELLGLAGMLDAPRPEAADAIRTCHAAGIRPLMITGDHPLTARAVAGELGLLGEGEVVSGPELAAMDDATLARRAPAIQIYARVSPADKLRVVGALQAAGGVVAMTGDGVNDAPALKKADVGVAMGITGTDVSKEASAMILTDDNFASIVAAVEEGRAIFDNVKKYLMYLLSSNVGEIALMAGALLVGLPVPLTAVQILYVNLATDGLPALALAFDPHAGDLMSRRPRDPAQGIFTPPVVRLMLTGGFWSGLVNVSLFAWALSSGRPLDEAMTMTFVSLVLIQFFKAFSFRSERHSILVRPFENRWLDLAVLWELAVLAAVVYWPPMHTVFKTFPLSAVDALVVAAASFSVVPVLETAKWLGRRRG